MRVENVELHWERGHQCWADDCWRLVKPGTLYCSTTCANRTRRRRERYRHQLAELEAGCRLCGATHH